MDSFPYVVLLLAAMTSWHLSYAKIINLSHKHGPNTLASNFRHPKFNRSTLEKGVKNYGLFVEAGWFSTSEHEGTHIDAPNHLSEGAMSLDEIPIEYTILEGVMIDSAEEAKGNDEYLLPVQKLLDWEAKHGKIPEEAAILFNFNWSRKFDDELVYKGTTDMEDIPSYKFPAVSREAADWLLENRKPRLVASDTMSPDPFQVNGKMSNLQMHRRYLPDNRLIVENLKDVWQLPPRGFRFHASPVAYMENTGAPIRAYAMTYDSEGNAAPRAAGGQFSWWTGLGLLMAIPAVAWRW